MQLSAEGPQLLAAGPGREINEGTLIKDSSGRQANSLRAVINFFLAAHEGKYAIGPRPV